VSQHAAEEPASVSIVAANPETLDELQLYLRGAGIASARTLTLGATAEIPSESSAVVVFPDEFPADDVNVALAGLRHERPSTLVVLVTSSPHRYRTSVEGGVDAHGLPLLTLPKPVLGWAILDALRAHLGGPARSMRS
jgi:hypothetical protein